MRSQAARAIAAATGMFVELLALPLFQHDMRCVIGLIARAAVSCA
jgi:hypothetical protein